MYMEHNIGTDVFSLDIKPSARVWKENVPFKEPNQITWNKCRRWKSKISISSPSITTFVSTTESSIHNSSGHINNINTTTDYENPLPSPPLITTSSISSPSITTFVSTTESSIHNSSGHINNINTTTDYEILIHNSSDHINNIHTHIDQESHRHFHRRGLTFHVEFVCESKEAEKNRDRNRELIGKSVEDYAAAVGAKERSRY
ncbi:hypothetical protein HID58_080573 [Brassica napus]|uniref:Uncharacterized protein n=1 Tax=Brassica napus TaxID=3708 RepID=A0ABQ7Y5A6_BRANA|nr:hypothetical protein HID58_080573 [Brassica napus]